jgi:hypothetical protein
MILSLLIGIYLTTLPVAQAIQRLLVRLLSNNELEKLCMKAIVAPEIGNVTISLLLWNKLQLSGYIFWYRGHFHLPHVPRRKTKQCHVTV